VVVKEKRKKPIYLVCTNLHLPAIVVIQYYAKRWKIEQMIKDLKQRLGLDIIKYELSKPSCAMCLGSSKLCRSDPS